MRGGSWTFAEREAHRYQHCRLRMAERYRLGMTLREYRQLCQTLRTAVRNPVAYSWGGREILVIMWGGKPTKAVYDPQEGLIVTFLYWHNYETTPLDTHAWHRDKKRGKQKKKFYQRLTPKAMRDQQLIDFVEQVRGEKKR